MRGSTLTKQGILLEERIRGDAVNMIIRDKNQPVYVLQGD